MQKFLLIFLFAVLSIGCKNNDKQDTSVVESKTAINQPKKLTVNFSFKTNKPDVFQIMMNNIEVDDLQKKNIQIFEDVVPSTGDDAIVAEFGANNMSKQIVFHLGNKTIKEVEIKSILVAYGKNQYNLTTVEDINKYLAFNKFVVRDTLNKTIKTKRVDGKLNPTFRIKNNLINLLKREY